MVTIKKITTEQSRQEYIKMSKEFFSSEAVLSNISEENFHLTFDEAISSSSLCDAFFINYEKEIVGFILIAFSWNNDFGGKVIWLEEVYVRPKHQGKGIFKQAYNLLEEMYKDQIKGIRLEASKDNLGAIRLYENLSFKVRGYTQYYKEI